MTLSATKLRAIVNLLSDPGSAANAASILAKEARERGLLVSNLVAQTIAPASSTSSPPPSAPPRWQDVGDEDDGPYTKRIDADHIGLVGVLVAETPKAWCVETTNGADAWLPKSQVVEPTGGRRSAVPNQCLVAAFALACARKKRIISRLASGPRASV